MTAKTVETFAVVRTQMAMKKRFAHRRRYARYPLVRDSLGYESYTSSDGNWYCTGRVPSNGIYTPNMHASMAVAGRPRPFLHAVDANYAPNKCHLVPVTVLGVESFEVIWRGIYRKAGAACDMYSTEQLECTAGAAPRTVRSFVSTRTSLTPCERMSFHHARRKGVVSHFFLRYFLGMLRKSMIHTITDA